MTHLNDTLWIELRKAWRSRMPLFTALGFLMMPLISTALIFLYKYPELSRKLGLVGTKATIIAESAADWPAYLKLVEQFSTIAGFFLFCIIISWIFGREFTDNTLKDLLSVPVPRASILMAKFIVFAGWAFALSVENFVVSLFMGSLLNLGGGSPALILQAALHTSASILMTILVLLPFAFLASAGRGYLLPLGLAILSVILANLLAIAGWGDYYPWGIPGLYAQDFAMPPVSFVLVGLTGLCGMLATSLWWKYADQSR